MKPLNPYFQNPNSMNLTPSQPLLGQQIPGKQSLTELIGNPRRPMIGQPIPGRAAVPAQPMVGQQPLQGSPMIGQPIPQQLPIETQAQPMVGQQPPQRLPKAERKARRLTGLGKYPGSNSQYMGGSPNFNEQTGAYIS